MVLGGEGRGVHNQTPVERCVGRSSTGRVCVRSNVDTGSGRIYRLVRVARLRPQHVAAPPPTLQVIYIQVLMFLTVSTFKEIRIPDQQLRK